MIKNGFILSPTAVLSTVPRAKQLYTKSYFFLKLNLKGKSENSKNCKAIIFMRTKAVFLFCNFKQLKKIIQNLDLSLV